MYTNLVFAIIFKNWLQKLTKITTEDEKIDSKEEIVFEMSKNNIKIENLLKSMLVI